MGQGAQNPFGDGGTSSCKAEFTLFPPPRGFSHWFRQSAQRWRKKGKVPCLF